MSRTAKMLLLAFFTLTLASSCIKKNKEVLTTPYTQMEFTSAVESQKFELYSNFLWTIEISDPWVTVSPAKGYGDKELSVTVTANTDLNVRTASFFIVGESTRKEIIITQAGEAPVMQLNVNEKNIDANGGTISVELTTNVETAITTDVDWLQLSQTRTVQTGTYAFTVAPNTSLSERTGKVQFKQTDGSLSALLTVAQSGEVPAVKVSVDSIAVGYEGGDVSFDVASNIKWSVASTASWLTEAATKLVETKTIHYTSEANPRVEPRKAQLTVTATDYPDMTPAQITVYQLGAPAAMTLSKDTLDSIPASGAVRKVLVEANFVWTVDASQTAEWVSQVTPTATEVEITVAKNEDITARSTKVVLRQKEGDYSKTLVINQLAGKSSITLPPQSGISTVKAQGGYMALPILSNTTWKAEVNRDWVHVVSTKGMELETLTLAFDANPDAYERKALLVVTTQEDSVVTRILTQEAAVAQLVLTEDTLNVSQAAGNYTTTVVSNVKWAVNSKPDWVSAVTLADGADDYHQTLGITVAANTVTAPRSGKILLKQTETTGTPLTATLVVNQAAAPIYVNASVSYTQPLDNEGDWFQLSVASNIEVGYHLVGSPSWIQMTGTSTDGNTATYKFSVQPAIDAASRSVQLQVVDTQKDTIYKTFTVVQKGARIAHSDSLALVQFYNNTNGATWKDTYVWNLQLPATTWRGVTLETAPRADGAFHVKRIELPNARLVGAIGDVQIGDLIVSADPLTALTYIEVIDLSNNAGLIGTLPVTWSQLTFLETLNVADCNLVNSALGGGFNIPKQYGKFSANLTVFKVKGNLLSGVLPAEVVAHSNFVQWNFDENIKTQKQGDLTLP